MSPIVREYYRLPRGDREVYIRPPVAELPALVERNRGLISSYNFDLGGRPVGEFRAAARAEIMQLARAYAAKWGFAVQREWSEPAPIVVTGHQPPPFHPGVWIKNFLAGSLASAVGGAALNLTVDSDEARGQVYRFPVCRPGDVLGVDGWHGHAPLRDHAAIGGQTPFGAHGHATARDHATRPMRAAQARRVNDGDEVQVREVALAPSLGGVAFEEQGAGAFDAAAFAEVLRGVPAALAEPLRRCGTAVQAAALAATSLAEALAVARRKEEEALGLGNLELPVSAMADTAAFRHFVAWMMAEHEQVFAAYNGALAEYRRVYRERSSAQPVPDLARDGGRVELPLWVWRVGQARRKLWVEPGQGGGLTVYADQERAGVRDADAVRARGGSRGACPHLAELSALREAGWKVRPRALAMTLFVRLAVGDAFLHGLGGALYDKITDAMFERLWGVRPPEIVLASCTVFLPLPAYPATPADLAAARRAVRDWRFNPDRKMSAAVRARPEVDGLADLKQQLYRGMRTIGREDRRRAFQRIHEINGALARFEPDGPAAAQKELARIQRQLRYNAVLRNREYPFCFYPAEELAAFYRGATGIQ
jgi:hypothetical protein